MFRVLRDAVGIVVPLTLALWAATAAALGPFHTEGFAVASPSPESYALTAGRFAPVAGPDLAEEAAHTGVVSVAGGTSGRAVEAPATAGREQAALAVQIRADKETARRGSPITYAVQVRNTGTLDATRVVVESHVPAGTSLNGAADCVGSSAVPGALCPGIDQPGRTDPSTEHISHAFTILHPGGVAIWRFTVFVDLATPRGTIITNHAHARAANVLLVTSKSVEVMVT